VIPVTTFDRSIHVRLLSMRERLLRDDPGAPSGKATGEVEEIESALLRFVQGTFGLCARCGGALGRQRLLAEPTARFCEFCLRISAARP